MSPDDTKTLYNLAFLYLQKEKNRDTDELFRKLEKLLPHDPEIRVLANRNRFKIK